MAGGVGDERWATLPIHLLRQPAPSDGPIRGRRAEAIIIDDPMASPRRSLSDILSRRGGDLFRGGLPQTPLADMLLRRPSGVEDVRNLEVRLNESVGSAAERTARDDARARADAEARRLSMGESLPVSQFYAVVPAGVEPAVQPPFMPYSRAQEASDAFAYALNAVARRLTENVDRSIRETLLMGPGMVPPQAPAPTTLGARTFFGLPFRVDPSMEPGTWRLEEPEETRVRAERRRLFFQMDLAAPMLGAEPPGDWNAGDAIYDLRRLREDLLGDLTAEYQQAPDPAEPSERILGAPARPRPVAGGRLDEHGRVQIPYEPPRAPTRAPTPETARFEEREAFRQRMRSRDAAWRAGKLNYTDEHAMLAEARAVRAEAESEGHEPRVLALHPEDLRAVERDLTGDSYLFIWYDPDRWAFFLWEDAVVVPWDRLERGEVFLCEDEAARTEGLIG